MFFEDEPEHMKRTRQVPLRSTWESRQPFERRATPPSQRAKPVRAPGAQ